MRSGFDTLCAVFDAITIDNLTTKREIAEMLGLSVVSVSKSVNELIQAGLIVSDGNIATGGRRSSSLSPAYFTKYPIVDLSTKPFSYTFAYLGETIAKRGTSASVEFVPYIRDLDFTENVSMLVNKLSSQCGAVTAAIALPSPSEFPEDHLGDDILSMFTRRGFIPAVTVSRASAVAASPSVLKAPSPAIYVSIDKNVSGMYFGDSVLSFNWNSVTVDGMPFSEILKCAQDAQSLADKTEKLLRSASEYFGAKAILLDTYDLPAETVDILLDSMDILEDVTFSSPVHEGLCRLLTEKLITEIPSAHMVK